MIQDISRQVLTILQNAEQASSLRKIEDNPNHDADLYQQTSKYTDDEGDIFQITSTIVDYRSDNKIDDVIIRIQDKDGVSIFANTDYGNRTAGIEILTFVDESGEQLDGVSGLEPYEEISSSTARLDDIRSRYEDAPFFDELNSAILDLVADEEIEGLSLPFAYDEEGNRTLYSEE